VELAKRCFDKVDCDLPPEFTQQPVDPNEKSVISKRFIRNDERLVYPIHFENIGNVEALDVFITDVLDSNLDLTTLEILTPNGSSFNPVTRTVRWELLNRNLQPGETDNVLLSIKPLANLPAGTKIRNKADIQFEIFSPITTNEVVNIIDTAPPTSKMKPLPPEVSTPEFPISWSGTDSIGEVNFYSIFVSVNNGVFIRFIDQTSDTTATFHGEPGKTYGFATIAYDKAGNKETKEPEAEAVTRVTGTTSVDSTKSQSKTPTEYALLQNYPNPFNPVTEIQYQLPQAGNVELIVYNILGQKVRTLVNKTQTPGFYTIRWDGKNDAGSFVTSGVYLFQLKTKGFSKVKKMLIVR
jgi:uncharacterized repeat protein (TIGR01451 family)